MATIFHFEIIVRFSWENAIYTMWKPSLDRNNLASDGFCHSGTLPIFYKERQAYGFII
jgi:hypothetical protein